MGLFNLFRRNAHAEAARALYGAVVEQARQPGFYTSLGVPDTVDGRYDMVALHAFLVMRRLKAESAGAEEQALSQALFDIMFVDIERNLRELGVSDIAVGGRVKSVAKGFFGRVAAYDGGLAAPDDGVLIAALRRNVYRKQQPDDDHLAVLATYVRRQAAHLDQQSLGDLRQGQVQFTGLPDVIEVRE
ncbi:ubiquinol-cytochrome C chaperone family protein [Magnetospira thiophila]